MLCPKCGINVGEEQPSCPNCGTAMVQKPDREPVSADSASAELNAEPDAAGQTPDAGQTENGSGSLATAIGALVLLMVIAGWNAHAIVNNLMAHDGYFYAIAGAIVNLGILWGFLGKGRIISAALVVFAMILPGAMTWSHIHARRAAIAEFQQLFEQEFTKELTRIADSLEQANAAETTPVSPLPPPK